MDINGIDDAGDRISEGRLLGCVGQGTLGTLAGIGQDFEDCNCCLQG